MEAIVLSDDVVADHPAALAADIQLMRPVLGIGELVTG